MERLDPLAAEVGLQPIDERRTRACELMRWSEQDADVASDRRPRRGQF
jgi:hypothetical protein